MSSDEKEAKMLQELNKAGRLSVNQWYGIFKNDMARETFLKRVAKLEKEKVITYAEGKQNRKYYFIPDSGSLEDLWSRSFSIYELGVEYYRDLLQNDKLSKKEKMQKAAGIFFYELDYLILFSIFMKPDAGEQAFAIGNALTSAWMYAFRKFCFVLRPAREEYDEALKNILVMIGNMTMRQYEDHEALTIKLSHLDNMQKKASLFSGKTFEMIEKTLKLKADIMFTKGLKPS